MRTLHYQSYDASISSNGASPYDLMTAKISVYKMYNLQFRYLFFSVLEKGIKISFISSIGFNFCGFSENQLKGYKKSIDNDPFNTISYQTMHFNDI